MVRDMAIVLGGYSLPKPSRFKKIETLNGTDIKTLGGVVYTDFVSYSRQWVIGWDNILYERDIATIKTIWDNQRLNRVYPMLQFNSENLYVSAKIDISEQDIRYNGTVVEAFEITLTERNPLS